MVDQNTESDTGTLRDHPETLNEHDGSQLVGVDSDGGVHYYDPVDKRLAKGDPEDGEVDPEWDDGRDLGPDESLSDVIDDIEETVGWDQLTDYAEDVLGDDDT